MLTQIDFLENRKIKHYFKNFYHISQQSAFICSEKQLDDGDTEKRFSMPFKVAWYISLSVSYSVRKSYILLQLSIFYTVRLCTRCLTYSRNRSNFC